MIRLAAAVLVLALAFAVEPAFAAGQLIEGNAGADSYTWTRLFRLFTDIVKLLIQIATILAAGFLMYGGWLYLSSGGDTGKVARAHEVFKNVGWGFLLLLGAWLVVVTLLESLGADRWLLNFFGR